MHSQMAAGEKSISARQVFDLLSLVKTAQKEDTTCNYFLTSSRSFSNFRNDLKNTEFLTQFDIFLREYWHRGTFESEVSLPQYHEDPIPLLQSIRTHDLAGSCRSPEEIYGRQKEDAKKTWQDFIDRLPLLKRLVLVLIARRSLRMMVSRSGIGGKMGEWSISYHESVFTTLKV